MIFSVLSSSVETSCKNIKKHSYALLRIIKIIYIIEIHLGKAEIIVPDFD